MHDMKVGDRIFIAIAVVNGTYGPPRGIVHEVEVIAVTDGSVVGRNDTLGVVTAGGSGTYRPFRTEAEAWVYCAGRLRDEAAALNAAAEECIEHASQEAAA